MTDLRFVQPLKVNRNAQGQQVLEEPSAPAFTFSADDEPKRQKLLYAPQSLYRVPATTIQPYPNGVVVGEAYINQDLQPHTLRPSPEANSGFLNGHSRLIDLDTGLGPPLHIDPTLSLFNHFFQVIGPKLSIIQTRCRPRPSVGSGAKKPTCFRGGLWTSELPKLATHGSALLSAMLALASHDAARMSGSSPTTAYHYYGQALEKIKAGLERKLSESYVMTNLAASLLLAFFEVITINNPAWMAHLTGGIQVITSFRCRSAMQYVAYVQTSVAPESIKSNTQLLDPDVDSLRHFFPPLDVKFFKRLIGDTCKPLPFASRHEIVPDQITPTQIWHCQMLQDLFWYARGHDVIRAFVLQQPVKFVNFQSRSGQPPTNLSPKSQTQIRCFEMFHASFIPW